MQEQEIFVAVVVEDVVNAVDGGHLLEGFSVSDEVTDVSDWLEVRSFLHATIIGCSG